MVNEKFVVKIKTQQIHAEVVKWLKHHNITYNCTRPQTFCMVKNKDRSWEIFYQDTEFEFDNDQDAILFSLRWLNEVP